MLAMTKYIAIDGAGGAGKTHLSILLAEKLNCKVFHLDDFGNDYQPFIGIPAMIEAVRSLDDEVVIIEGIGVFDERFNFLKPFRIYVDTPEDLRSERAINRDTPTADRSAEDWAIIYKIWEAEASDYIRESRNLADMIVTDSDARVADMIVERTKKFLG